MIGVIADDFTGAAELGGIGLRYGLRAQLLISGALPRSAELVCIDTDSRGGGPEPAAERARAAAAALQNAGAELIYKKVDSVLRGHVRVEISAIQKQLGARGSLLASANPSLGRVVRDGIYYVRGVPLAETDFRFDPLYPRKSSRVTELLKTVEGDAIRVCRPGEPLPPDGLTVAEVSTSEDLGYWAGILKSDMLAAGGAEFFSAILQSRGYQPAVREVEEVSGPELFVCGSPSESTRGFLARSRAEGVTVITLPESLACAEEFDKAEALAVAETVRKRLGVQPRVVLALELPPQDRMLGPRMEARLAEIALSSIASDPSVRVFAEGGATAAAIVRAAGWSCLSVAREYAQGVVGTLTPNDPPRWFAVKPGSYSWPDELLKVSLRRSR